MKDPAFLFYYRDWKSSTEKMSNTERGAYIQLICLQAENGHVTDIDMKKICSNICFDTMQVQFDQNTYKTVKSKFMETETGSGMYINARLAEEIEKRIKYSESRRNNRKSKYEKSYENTHAESYDKHMVNVNENRNINTNINVVQGEKNNEPSAPLPIVRHADVHDPTTGQFVQTKTNEVDKLWAHPSAGTENMRYEIIAKSNQWDYPKITKVYEVWVESRKSDESKKFNRNEAMADFRKFCLSWKINESEKSKNGKEQNGKAVNGKTLVYT